MIIDTITSDLLVNYVNDVYASISRTFSTPNKRVYWGYLAAAFFIAVAWLYFNHSLSIAQSGKKLLSKRVWLHPSAIADLKVLLLNKAINLTFLPLLITKTTLAIWLFNSLFAWIGTRPFANSLLPDWAVPILFTLFLFLLDDFARYFLHRAMHRVPALWAFHKVHHSARRLTPLTVLRTHPVEGLLFTLRSILVQGISIGLFVYLFGDQVTLVTILGVNAVVFMFNLTGSNLRHSHVSIRYGKHVEQWLISPAQHQIHHSVEQKHFDRNFGAMLAIWDRMGKSLYLSNSGEHICFGLSRRSKPNEHSLKRLYLQPFKDASAALLNVFRR